MREIVSEFISEFSVQLKFFYIFYNMSTSTYCIYIVEYPTKLINIIIYAPVPVAPEYMQYAFLFPTFSDI